MDIKAGDRIKFRSPTRGGCRTVWRTVNGFWHNGEPTVSYEGWTNFVVHLNEIREISRYGDKRDFPKIDIYSAGEYVASTTWADTCRAAVARYVEANPGARHVRAYFAKGI